MEWYIHGSVDLMIHVLQLTVNRGRWHWANGYCYLYAILKASCKTTTWNIHTLSLMDHKKQRMIFSWNSLLSAHFQFFSRTAWGQLHNFFWELLAQGLLLSLQVLLLLWECIWRVFPKRYAKKKTRFTRLKQHATSRSISFTWHMYALALVFQSCIW